MTGIYFNTARAPEGMRLYAIGDVHGRLDLLDAMHRFIAEEIARDAPADWRIVHLGDYIDRGSDSKGVLNYLAAAHERDARHVFLAGNHELGLLDFLKAPSTTGLFFRYGGIETALSYGVDLIPTAIEEGRDALAAALPQEHLAFVKALGFSFEAGDFFFCHAGIRPGVALHHQLPHDLVWIRDSFLAHEALHPKVVVHGHTPGETADVRPNRVNLDSWAYSTGRLSALAVDGAEKRILEATPQGVVQRTAATTP